MKKNVEQEPRLSGGIFVDSRDDYVMVLEFQEATVAVRLFTERLIPFWGGSLVYWISHVGSGGVYIWSR